MSAAKTRAIHAWRIRTGKTTSLVVPVSLLAAAMAGDDLRRLLIREFGIDVARAVAEKGKAAA